MALTLSTLISHHHLPSPLTRVTILGYGRCDQPDQGRRLLCARAGRRRIRDRKDDQFDDHHQQPARAPDMGRHHPGMDDRRTIAAPSWGRDQ